MCPTSIAVWNRSAPPHSGHASPSVASRRSAKRAREVASVLDPAEVEPGPVRACDELPLAERLVGDDLAREADGPERAGVGAERGADLVLGRRPVSCRRHDRASPPTSRSSPRTSASTTVPSSRVTGIAFDVAAASMPSSSASASIVVTPGVSISSGASSRSGKLGAPRDPAARSRGRPRSRRARSATSVFSPEPDGARKSCDSLPPIIPDSACHLVDLEPAALEDAVVGASLELEAAVEPLVVDVERVGVLHHELAHAEEAAARARLVPLLRLEVVEHLRQLPVLLQLARVEGERLLVRQREHELAPAPVGQLEELGDLVAAGLPARARPASAPAPTSPGSRSRPSPRG